jgi:O-antigen/teichoic acid export membrane protein
MGKNFKGNVIFVLAGSMLGNVFNLLCQLLLAHRLVPADFAVFNALLSIFTVVFAPLSTLQTAVVKYTADFNSKNEFDRIRGLLSGILKVVLALALCLAVVLWMNSSYFVRELKIPSLNSFYILVLIVFASVFGPVFLGGAQGMERFGWIISASLAGAVLKFALVFVFLLWGWGINGALWAFAVSSFTVTVVGFIPVRKFFTLRPVITTVPYRDFAMFFFPVAVSLFCFSGLVNLDMVLVKRFFAPDAAGAYSLSQMVGKIFLFLPSAISIVLFPRTAGLNARNQDTRGTLRQSLVLAFLLCAGAGVFYNLFPGFVLSVLVGKVSPETVMLGRFFSVSMSLFALVNILISYFLSLRDGRFIKYLVISAAAQYLFILMYHASLPVIQGIMCGNAAVLLAGFCFLAFNRKAYARV